MSLPVKKGRKSTFCARSLSNAVCFDSLLVRLFGRDAIIFFSLHLTPNLHLHVRRLSFFTKKLMAMDELKLFVKRLSASATLPKRGSKSAAGYDLASAKAVVVPAHG